MFAVYDLCAVLTPCGPLKILIGMIQDKQAPLPGLIYEADVRDGVGNAPPAAAPAKPAAAAAVPRSSSSTSTSSGNSTRNNQQRSAPAGTPAARPPVAAPAPPAAPVEGRPRNVAESDFTTYDCETMEQLVALLEEFYRTFSPDDVWKASQVADKFFPTQQRLWLLLFHKYMVCSCSIDIPCPVQARHAARERRQQEDDEDDKTIKLGLGDFIFYSVLVGRAAIFDFSTFAVTFLCIVMVRRSIPVYGSHLSLTSTHQSLFFL
jgi:presenilin 1